MFFVPGISKITASVCGLDAAAVGREQKVGEGDILGSVTEMPVPSVRTIETLACIMEEGRKVVKAES